ncbi:MAG: hypothetical protein AB8F94_28120 [Saprospiraceae bacterium]
MKNTFFFDMIKTLREQEEIILYQNILSTSEEEKEKVILFLEKEYQAESSEFPFVSPEFHPQAALWAAEISYYACQFILFRENDEAKMEDFFPAFQFEVSPSTILSVDLCFRFIPDMLRQLSLIDSEDSLIAILEKYLKTWHFSGINYSLNLKDLDLNIIFTDPCLQQLYLNRITTYKNIHLAKSPKINQLLKANFGIFEETFWPNFKTLSIND